VKPMIPDRPVSAEIRQFLTESFDDKELKVLCFDYFPEVHDEFASGMTKEEMTLLLVGYCQRRELIPNLLAAIRRARPDQYKKRFPQAMNQTIPLSPQTQMLPHRSIVQAWDWLCHLPLVAWAGIIMGVMVITIAVWWIILEIKSPPPTPPPPVSTVDIVTRTRSTDGMVMVYVPTGTFQMGSDKRDTDANGDEFPQHPVTLDAFWIDQTEVTNKQYRKCVQLGACSRSAFASDPRLNNDNQPVVGANFDEAQGYCKWVGAALPTEAQWEKAARGTDGRIYPWGDLPATCDFAVMDEGNGNGCGKDVVAPVGSKPRGISPYGALDMVGNVWEWVDDWYRGYPGTNFTSPFFGEMYRVLRGGSWQNYHTLLRAASRKYYTKDFQRDFIGFRCMQANHP
jgi:formylglycine-generating enzyme required for sulfatase activity